MNLIPNSSAVLLESSLGKGLKKQPKSKPFRGQFKGAFQAIATAGLAAGMVAAIAPVAAAHGARVQYKAINTPSGTAVQVLAEYDTSEPMKEAQVTIYHPDEPQNPWLTGKTDAEGYFEFTPDQAGSWDIKVRHAGHGAFVTMEWPPETALATQELATLGSGSQKGLPQWLGLGLGVAGCLGGAWLAMRRSPGNISSVPGGVSGSVEIAD
ncbi:MAG: hypothetical protein ACFCBU_15510 [Cyanophyceae cyanobacterium]